MVAGIRFCRQCIDLDGGKNVKASLFQTLGQPAAPGKQINGGLAVALRLSIILPSASHSVSLLLDSDLETKLLKDSIGILRSNLDSGNAGQNTDNLPNRKSGAVHYDGIFLDTPWSQPFRSLSYIYLFFLKRAPTEGKFNGRFGHCFHPGWKIFNIIILIILIHNIVALRKEASTGTRSRDGISGRRAAPGFLDGQPKQDR